jgi:outer membrane lipoprotein SlyB
MTTDSSVSLVAVNTKSAVACPTFGEASFRVESHLSVASGLVAGTAAGTGKGKVTAGVVGAAGGAGTAGCAPQWIAATRQIPIIVEKMDDTQKLFCL